MSSAVATKLATILNTDGRRREHEETFFALAEDLERYLLHLTGQAHRDLDRLEYEWDGDMGIFVGWESVDCYSPSKFTRTTRPTWCCERRKEPGMSSTLIGATQDRMLAIRS